MSAVLCPKRLLKNPVLEASAELRLPDILALYRERYTAAHS